MKRDVNNWLYGGYSYENYRQNKYFMLRQIHFSAELHCKMLMVNLDQLQSRGPATPCRNAFILCRNIGRPRYLQPSALLQFAIIFTGIHTSAFGLGTMVYIGLEFGSWFEIPWDSPCYQVRSLDMCKYFSKYSNIFRLCEE